MDLHRYVAEEIAADHADGLISRREALRRLALMGIGAAGASALLAACGGGGDDEEPAARATSTTSPTPTDTTALAARTEAIAFAGPDGELRAAWAAAPRPRGAVLVVHENRGLTEHIRSVAARLAGDGYSSLAVDLLSAAGGTQAVPAGDAPARLAQLPAERLVGDLRAGLGELERRTPGVKLAAVGFCFGGGLVWRLLASGERRLAAAVPFYGPAPDPADFSGSRAAVLAIYAERDARVNATRDHAVAALQRARLVHEVRTFPDADHAFFNDTGPRYDATAARDAYRALLDWLGRHLA